MGPQGDRHQGKNKTHQKMELRGLTVWKEHPEGLSLWGSLRDSGHKHRQKHSKSKEEGKKQDDCSPEEPYAIMNVVLDPWVSGNNTCAVLELTGPTTVVLRGPGEDRARHGREQRARCSTSSGQ